MAPKTTIDFRKPVEAAAAAAALSCSMKNCGGSGGGENVAAVADGFFS